MAHCTSRAAKYHALERSYDEAANPAVQVRFDKLTMCEPGSSACTSDFDALLCIT
eukprot:CAMPEP_0202914300 /NCGR_PEP_ID=MMETSP1392-20130828/62753_1 /ASSEMBLY_ACC=CAM_ASM_000868 /TAXON_ID=225041 /ORGANISM="Chlamydomonas chlamydogama, Strain SAG 11-48b" /LENGTH=54 /DNA_ID=CAMNT_0049605901 /DNA_START=367 /DNA_END=527 /DNA_ORIENTATION=+